MGRMKNFALKLKEAAVAVIPITALVLILNFALGGMPTLNLASFLVGAVFLIIGMALACVAAVLLSKLLWGKTDCSVTNVTLLATMSGPLAFLALVLVIVLAIAVVQLVLAIAAVAIAGVCLIGSISGG